jgi:hypothetical protein
MAGVVTNILRWFSGRGAAHQDPTDTLAPPAAPPPAVTPVEPRVDRPAAKVEAVIPASHDDEEEARPAAEVVAAPPVTPIPITPKLITPAAVETRPIPVPSNGNGAPVVLDAQEIQRRRELVRSLFNDFWSDSDEKPAAFVDRLDQAESYLNERLSASGEPWQIDANTRKVLGLPARSNSRGAAAARR